LECGDKSPLSPLRISGSHRWFEAVPDLSDLKKSGDKSPHSKEWRDSKLQFYSSFNLELCGL
jgi:hypothetical protein